MTTPTPTPAASAFQVYLAKFRNIAIAGFLFLMPVYVVLVVATKAWTSLASVGTGLAKMFGLKAIMGVGASTVLSGVLLIVIWFACGLLVHVSFVNRFGKTIENWLAKYIPGYATYRTMAEEKLQGAAKTIPYTSALMRQQDLWQPVYVVEQDDEGDYVVFVPSVPDTSTGTIVLATQRDLRFVPSLSATHLDASLKKFGVGLLSEHRLQRELVRL